MKKSTWIQITSTKSSDWSICFNTTDKLHQNLFGSGLRPFFSRIDWQDKLTEAHFNQTKPVRCENTLKLTLWSYTMKRWSAYTNPANKNMRKTPYLGGFFLKISAASSDPPLEESTWALKWGCVKQLRCSIHHAPLQLHGINKASIYSFIWHMFIVKQKQNPSIDSIRGQTATPSFVRVFPRWTLIFFWSTSSGHGVTDEVISRLFWSDRRDWLQMWGLRGRVSHEKR